MAETITKVTKVRRMVDVEVMADLSATSRHAQSVEQSARWLRDRARAFNDFIKDHRSQDDIRLDVREIWQDLCSGCGREWELMTDEQGDECCAWCGDVLEGESTNG